MIDRELSGTGRGSRLAPEPAVERPWEAAASVGGLSAARGRPPPYAALISVRSAERVDGDGAATARNERTTPMRNRR